MEQDRNKPLPRQLAGFSPDNPVVEIYRMLPELYPGEELDLEGFARGALECEPVPEKKKRQ